MKKHHYNTYYNDTSYNLSTKFIKLYWIERGNRFTKIIMVCWESHKHVEQRVRSDKTLYRNVGTDAEVFILPKIRYCQRIYVTVLLQWNDRFNNHPMIQCLLFWRFFLQKHQNFNLFYSQGFCSYLCPHLKVPEQTPPLLLMASRALRHVSLLCARASGLDASGKIFFFLIILYVRFCGASISNAWLTLTHCISGVRHHGKYMGKVSLLLISLLRVCRLQKIINWSLSDFSKLSEQRKASAPIVLRRYKSSGIDLWLQREKLAEKKINSRQKIKHFVCPHISVCDFPINVQVDSFFTFKPPAGGLFLRVLLFATKLTNL